MFATWSPCSRRRTAGRWQLYYTLLEPVPSRLRHVGKSMPEKFSDYFVGASFVQLVAEGPLKTLQTTSQCLITDLD